ncbi:MAG TPA: hypothetical protein VK936_06845 [Longimicrobiales bacterium]|nr:hypothetical protein [Longimicrobiales bacterium]
MVEMVGRQGAQMKDDLVYDVVQGPAGWVLRHGRTPLVAFPTRKEAVRAGIAVCLDEGLGRLVVRRSDGGVEELDPRVYVMETFEA